MAIVVKYIARKKKAAQTAAVMNDINEKIITVNGCSEQAADQKLFGGSIHDLQGFFRHDSRFHAGHS